MKRTPGKLSLLLADVDGTLVTREKVLTERAKQAVQSLREAGIRFAITSGRPPRGMNMLIEPLTLDTPVAAFNGGLLVNPDLTPITERTIPPDVARDVVDMIFAAGLDAWLYAGNDWYIHRADVPHKEKEQKTVQFEPTVMMDFGDNVSRAVKITGVSDDHDQIKACADKIHQRFGHKVSAALSQPYYLDVTHPEATKGFVVADLSHRLSIPAEEIATIGDMPNDVEMFVKGGFAIAMGNASDEVKDQADAVTEDCDSEGFALAVERLILGRAQKR